MATRTLHKKRHPPSSASSAKRDSLDAPPASTAGATTTASGAAPESSATATATATAAAIAGESSRSSSGAYEAARADALSAAEGPAASAVQENRGAAATTSLRGATPEPFEHAETPAGEGGISTHELAESLPVSNEGATPSPAAQSSNEVPSSASASASSAPVDSSATSEAQQGAAGTVRDRASSAGAPSTSSSHGGALASWFTTRRHSSNNARESAAPSSAKPPRASSSQQQQLRPFPPPHASSSSANGSRTNGAGGTASPTPSFRRPASSSFSRSGEGVGSLRPLARRGTTGSDVSGATTRTSTSGGSGGGGGGSGGGGGTTAGSLRASISQTVGHSGPGSYGIGSSNQVPQLDDVWNALVAKTLPLFDAKPLKGYVEDMNELVQMHVQRVVARCANSGARHSAPRSDTASLNVASLATGLIVSDVTDLLALGLERLAARVHADDRTSGKRKVNANVDTVARDDAVLLAQLDEAWALFWPHILPMLEAVFWPLQASPGPNAPTRYAARPAALAHAAPSPSYASTSIAGGTSSPNLSSSFSRHNTSEATAAAAIGDVDVRKIALAGFRDHVVLPVADRLDALVRTGSRDGKRGLLHDSSATESEAEHERVRRARRLQMLLVLRSVQTDDERQDAVERLLSRAGPTSPTSPHGHGFEEEQEEDEGEADEDGLERHGSGAALAAQRRLLLRRPTLSVVAPDTSRLKFIRRRDSSWSEVFVDE